MTLPVHVSAPSGQPRPGNAGCLPRSRTALLRNLLVSSLAAIALGAEPRAVALPGDGAGEGVPTFNIETSDKPLETVLQWISRRAGVNIVCNEAEQPRVTIRLEKVTWQEAVEQIANRYDLVIERKSERIWQLTRPPKVRMEFQDARLTVVLEALARQANVNIVISDDVNGSKRLTMTLNGVPWRAALDVIVKATGYTWVEQDYAIVRVVSKENVQKDLQTRVLRLNYVNGADIIDAIKVSLSADGKTVVDKRTNSLVMTDTPPNLAAAETLIRQLDQRTPEVLIEMKFVSFSTTEAEKIGFDPISVGFDLANFGTIAGAFAPFAPSATVTANRNPLAVPTRTGNVSANLVFEAIASLNSTEIIQTPQLLTLNNAAAEIFIGQELRFAEETITTDGTGNVTSTLAEAKSSPVTDGITIKATPHITSDGFVSIDLLASDEAATIVAFSSNGSTIQLPNKATTKITTSVMVRDGHTAMIGGLLKNKVTEQSGHIPVLHRIPVLGYLFKSRDDEVQQLNLTLFITPHIIRHQDRDEVGEEKARLTEKISGVPQRPAVEKTEQYRTLGD